MALFHDAAAGGIARNAAGISASGRIHGVDAATYRYAGKRRILGVTRHSPGVHIIGCNGIAY
jgi:hypothetical protein